MREIVGRRMIPFLILLFGGSLVVRAQSSPKDRNVVSFDLETREGFDDNARGQNSSSLFLELAPTFSFRQQRRRGSWSVTYRPTLRRFSGLSFRDRLDHRLSFNTQLLLSKRWTLDFSHEFLRSTNPFLRVEEDNAPLTSDGVLFGPNRSLVGPEHRFTRLGSRLTLQYQLGPHSLIDFDLDFSWENQTDRVLLKRSSRSFRVAYSKQYAGNKEFQVQYALQHLRASFADTRVRTHSVVFQHTYTFRPGTSLALFAGEQISLLRAEPTIDVDLFFFILRLNFSLRQQVNSLALGGLFTHRLNDRTGLAVQISQRVAEGDFVGAGVTQRSARLRLNRQLTGRLSTSLTAYWSDNSRLGAFGRRVRTTGISTGFSYALNRRISIDGQYQFSRFGSGLQELQSRIMRNRFSVGFRYSFGPFSLGG